MCTGGCVMTQFRLIKHEWPLGGNNGDQWPPIPKIQKIMCRPYSKESMVKRWNLYVLWGLRNDSITADRPYYCPPLTTVLTLSYTVLEIVRIWTWAFSKIFFIFYFDKKSFWQHFDISSSFWDIANFPKNTFCSSACTKAFTLLKLIVMDSPDFLPSASFWILKIHPYSTKLWPF